MVHYNRSKNKKKKVIFSTGRFEMDRNVWDDMASFVKDDNILESENIEVERSSTELKQLCSTSLTRM